MANEMPPKIYAQASVESLGGTSLFAVDAKTITSKNAEEFTSTKQKTAAAVKKLKAEGFEVLLVSETSISIAAPAEVYERVFKTKLFSEEREVLSMQNETRTRSFIESDNDPKPGLIATNESSFANLLEGIAIAEPVEYFENAFAPTKSYWHLRVPGDVSLGMNSDKAHRKGITGKKIKVVMVDTGWYKHPFFVGRGYNANPVALAPGAINPLADENGHGTAESANIFSVAPDVDFTMVKSGVDSVAAFNAAVALKPQIITCSWGWSTRFGPLSAGQNTLAAAISLAVANGITVIFSAGNGHWGFPGQHPDVISAGGVYMEIDGAMQASNYSSGFASNIYPGRNVPDVSGLVGMIPKAAYIMLPVQPNDTIDAGMAGGTHPNGDETTSKDGWAAISGTSAAAPQIAGVCALLKQKKKTLTPAQIKKILKDTARDVTAGNCSVATLGHAATVGPDLATGHGLVDAFKAVEAV
jgi:subtilase family serine protease